MTKIGMALGLLIAACLPAAAQAGSYMLHAKIVHEKNGTVTITANSPRPLAQALDDLSREYGWVVDAESGIPDQRDLRLNADDRYEMIGGAFHAELPEPRTGSEAEETSILQKFVAEYNRTDGATIGPLFRLVHHPSSLRYDIVATSEGTPILDTPIQLPRAKRTIDETVREICTLVGEARGIHIDRGGIADSGLYAQQVVMGGGPPLPARDLLEQALDQMKFERVYNFGYSPFFGEFIIEIHAAVLAKTTATDNTRIFNIPRDRAESHR